MEILYFIIGILAFLLVLGISIGLHEYGHYSVARLFKLSVPKFFIGFGTTFFSFKTKNTQWGLKAIPLGGFVQIEDGRAERSEELDKLEKQYDEVNEEIANLKQQLKNRDNVLTDEQKKKIKSDIKEAQVRLTAVKKDYMPLYEAHVHEKSLLSRVHPFKRILIFAAGPVVNIVLGTVIIFGVLMGYSSTHVATSVDTVNSCASLKQGEKCGAEQGGMESGDKILAVDGQKVEQAPDISKFLKDKDSVEVTVERNGTEQFLNVPVEDGTIGIMLNTYERPLTFVESSKTIGNVLIQNVEAISEIPEKVPGIVKNIFGAERDPEAPSSIVSVGKTYGDTTASTQIQTDDKVKSLLLYSGLLNFSLGILNLIPFIFALDGGKIAIAFVDWFKMGFSKISRKEYVPVGVNAIKYITAITIVPLVGFMGLIILADVLNIGRGWI